jgi:carboxyl-terminal processing protease
MMTRLFTLLSAATVVALTPLRAQDTLAAGVAVATFDSVWAKIDRTYYDTAFLNTRWVTLRDSVRPLAAAAPTNAVLRGVVQGMLDQIGTSHFGLIAQESSPAIGADEAIATANPGSIGVQLRLVNDALVVFRADPSGPAWRAGVRPGDRITALGGRPVAEVITSLEAIADASVRKQARFTAAAMAQARTNRAPGDSVALEIGGVTRWIVAERARGQVQRFGNLPPMPVTVDVTERTVDGKRVGIIAFSVWMPVVVAQVDSAVDRLRDADAIIFDIRGNPGGVAGMVGGIAGHVVDTAALLGTLYQRGVTLSLRANPRRVSTQAERVTPFDGPVAVLIDEMSASASEFFAAALQGMERARIFGTTSAGASVPALMGRLPNGDVLLHAIADHTDSKGRRVEGVGVIPDEDVPLNAASLAAGRDEVVEAALRWAARQPRR